MALVDLSTVTPSVQVALCCMSRYAAWQCFKSAHPISNIIAQLSPEHYCKNKPWTQTQWSCCVCLVPLLVFENSWPVSRIGRYVNQEARTKTRSIFCTPTSFAYQPGHLGQCLEQEIGAGVAVLVHFLISCGRFCRVVFSPPHGFSYIVVCSKSTGQLWTDESWVKMVDPSCETRGKCIGSLGTSFYDKGGCDVTDQRDFHPFNRTPESTFWPSLSPHFTWKICVFLKRWHHRTPEFSHAPFPPLGRVPPGPGLHRYHPPLVRKKTVKELLMMKRIDREVGRARRCVSNLWNSVNIPLCWRV